ncbi:MAG: thioredoxin family protein [bacterium]
MSEANQEDCNKSKAGAYRWIIVAALVLAVSAAWYLRGAERTSTPESQEPAAVSEEQAAPAVAPQGEAGRGDPLPRLVDLGADKCIPCKKMAPILEQLRVDYAGRFEVVFIDVWKKRDEATKYDIKLIPTQIFFAADGKELFRHQGFFSREDILRTWQEHGYGFADGGAETEASS